MIRRIPWPQASIRMVFKVGAFLKQKALLPIFTSAPLNTRVFCFLFCFSALKSYFEKALEEKGVPSLRDFVRLNIDFIVRSPPDTNGIMSLSGAWTRRFLTTAKLLGIAKESILSHSARFCLLRAFESDFALNYGYRCHSSPKWWWWSAQSDFALNWVIGVILNPTIAYLSLRIFHLAWIA